MNKYQKALNHYDWNVPIRSVEQFKILQELVDKETPNKVLLDSEKHSPRCPNCDRWFPNRQEYCSRCGQRIDWGEE